jgi:hypothetical protein
MIQGKALLVGIAAVASFAVSACLLGAAVLFVVVMYFIGSHGAGLLPEWLHIPFLALCAGGVGYVSFKVAFWVQTTVANRVSAI